MGQNLTETLYICKPAAFKSVKDVAIFKIVRPEPIVPDLFSLVDDDVLLKNYLLIRIMKPIRQCQVWRISPKSPGLNRPGMMLLKFPIQVFYPCLV